MNKVKVLSHAAVVEYWTQELLLTLALKCTISKFQ